MFFYNRGVSVVLLLNLSLRWVVKVSSLEHERRIEKKYVSQREPWGK